MRMRAEQRRARHEGGHGSRAFRRSKNGDFALIEACLALRLCLGGGEEDSVAAGKICRAMYRLQYCFRTQLLVRYSYGLKSSQSLPQRTENQLGLRNFLSAKTSVLLIFVSSK